MSRYIDADAIIEKKWQAESEACFYALEDVVSVTDIEDAPSIDIVRCKECKKSHIDGKTTHYLWCCEWGRSTDTFGYCERGERKERE